MTLEPIDVGGVPFVKYQTPIDRDGCFWLAPEGFLPLDQLAALAKQFAVNSGLVIDGFTQDLRRRFIAKVRTCQKYEKPGLSWIIKEMS